MGLVVGVLILIVLLLVGGALLGLALNLLWYLLIGLLIGALARLVVPDTGGMGIFATALYGIAGALIGGIIGDGILDLGSIATFLFSIAAAAVLIGVLAAAD